MAQRGRPKSKTADEDSCGSPKINDSDLLPDNLTSGQIQDVLDTLILEAVKPIVLNTNSFDAQIVHLLGRTVKNRKRKLSALAREEVIDLMCAFLTTADKAYKVKLLSAMKLERSFITGFIVNFLKEVDGYTALYRGAIADKSAERQLHDTKRCNAIERAVGSDHDSLFGTIASARDYLTLAHTFRNKIVMNYFKHSFKHARAFVESKGRNFDVMDANQNFLAAVARAIDKFDASKGALTSYINFWLLSAQTSSNSLHGHEYGIAYTIPQNQKKALAEKSSKTGEVNFGVSLDSLVNSDGDETTLEQYLQGSQSVEKDILHDEALDEVRALAKSADIRGLARLYLDIDEVFSLKEKRQMVRTMREQLGVLPNISLSSL